MITIPCFCTHSDQKSVDIIRLHFGGKSQTGEGGSVEIERGRGRERVNSSWLEESHVCPEEKPCLAQWSIHESIPGVRIEWHTCSA